MKSIYLFVIASAVIFEIAVSCENDMECPINHCCARPLEDSQPQCVPREIGHLCTTPQISASLPNTCDTNMDCLHGQCCQDKKCVHDYHPPRDFLHMRMTCTRYCTSRESCELDECCRRPAGKERGECTKLGKINDGCSPRSVSGPQESCPCEWDYRCDETSGVCKAKASTCTRHKDCGTNECCKLFLGRHRCLKTHGMFPKCEMLI